MPDHFRQQHKGHIGNRSPSTDHPLSLVIGNRDLHQHHQAHSPPHKVSVIVPAHHHHGGHSPSSGYSDHGSASPGYSPMHGRDEAVKGLLPQPAHHQDFLRLHHHQIDHEEIVGDVDENEEGHEDEVEEAPLALVVDKSKRLSNSGDNRLETVHSGDSGHEDYYSGSSSPAAELHRSPQHRQEESSCMVQSREETSARVEIEPNITIAKITEQRRSHESQKTYCPAEDLSKMSGVASDAAGIKIRSFARMSCDGGERTGAEGVAAMDIAAANKSSTRMSSSGHSNHMDVEDFSDETSEISSMDTWTTGSITSFNNDQRRVSNSMAGNGGELLFPCELCDRVFVNQFHLQSHAISHSGERSFPCSKCGKCFGRKSTLRAHMTTHTKTSNFMCPLCEKACNDNNSLEEHIRMHTGEKPYICSICSKAYARKSHLNVHYRVHTGERPFVCNECNKDFTEKRFLNDHMQTAHSGHDGPLKCPNCYREFAYKTSLKQHLKKQMCVKNINRSQGNITHGTHAKQFQCPFCEKSYSWKQTLKQHVSMYHRNKVHTDEFWKYELAKHRKVGVDNSVNEDMWMKQLGKHAEEVQQSENGSSIADGGKRRESEPPPHQQHDQHHQEENEEENNESWLNQIQRSTSQSENQRAAVANEMKFIAMQSLQFMQMGRGMNPPPTVAREDEKQESYQHVLEQLRSTTSNKSTLALSLPPPTVNASPRSPSRSPSRSPMLLLPDIKEEPAAKRTQMWLAQLGRYRQRSLLQEELDRNHEELWEEQIARAKSNPVKSPLEPTEITVVVQEDSSKFVGKDPVDAVTAGAVARPLAPPKFGGMIPMMSALQVHPPPPGFQPRRPPSATITRPPGSQEEKEEAMVMPEPKYPAKIKFFSENTEVHNMETTDDEQKKKLTIPLENDIPELLINDNNHEEEKEEESDHIKKVKDNKPIESAEPPSFLMSILMNRKRPSVESSPQQQQTKDCPCPPPPSRLIKMSEESSHDILRRRLLGLKDPIVPTPTTATSFPSRNQQPSHLPGTGPNNHLLVPPPPSVNHNLLAPRFVPSTTATTATAAAAKPFRTSAATAAAVATALMPPPISPMVKSQEEVRQQHQHQQQQQQQQQTSTVSANQKKQVVTVVKDLEHQQQHQDSARTNHKQKEALSQYANTSVLKHLLYRYTENATTNY